MRALAALINFDGTPLPANAIESLLRAMAPGPVDRLAHRTAGPAALGSFHRTTVAEDTADQQPLPTPDGAGWLVADALLHNRADLAATFGWTAAEAAGRADSAYVLAAWARWGPQAPQHLEGRFAFAVWQPAESRLFCAVDPLSFRPLYFRHHAGRFACATTLRGLFSLPGVSRELSETGFAEGFAGLRSLSDETLYREIRRIPAGHTLTVDATGARLARYWQPWPRPELRLATEADYVAAFRAELERAVRASLRTTGEIGLLLSGGLDSSSVAAVAGQLLRQEGRRLHAFHRVPAAPNRYTTPALRELDESRFVDALRRHAPHIEFHFTTQPALVPLTPDERAAAWADNWVPQAPAPVHPLTEDDPFTPLGVTVLLNGFGGNFLVSPETAYTDYHGHLAVTGHWVRLLRELHGRHRVYGLSWRQLARELRHQLGSAPAPDPGWRHRLLNPALRARTGLAEKRQAQHDRLRQAARQRDFRARLADSLLHLLPQQVGPCGSVLSRTATVSSAGPLMSVRLNEFCLSLPPELQFRAGWDRRLLRESMRGLLPDEVRCRVTRGLLQPSFQRAFSTLRPQVLAQLEQLPADTRFAGWFDPAAIRALRDNLAAGGSGFAAENIATQLLQWTGFLAWLENSAAV